MENNELNELATPESPRWRWSDLILIILGAGFVLILGSFGISLLLRSQGMDITTSLGQPTIGMSLALLALEAIALVGGVYFFGMKRRGIDWEEIGLRKISTSWALIVLVIALVGIPITSLVTLLVLQLLNQPFNNPQLEFLLPKNFSWPGAIGLVLLGGFVVPFAEELLFRGVLYRFIRSRWGVWAGVLLSALIFGGIHLNIAVGTTAFILGIVLALLFEYSHSLWTSVLLHALNNTFRILLLYVLIALGINIGM
jgi:membrane protease YdiL (CAAX protease family)